MRATRRSSIFSPIVAAWSSIRLPTVPPSAGAASAMNLSFFATKSVSQASSMRVTAVALSTTAMRPSLVERSARFALPFAPLRRRISTAFSMSPSASTRAFFVSTMPVPRRSRRVLTSSRVKLAISLKSPELVVLLGLGGFGSLRAFDVGGGLGRGDLGRSLVDDLCGLGLGLFDGLGDDLGLGRSLRRGGLGTGLEELLLPLG